MPHIDSNAIRNGKRASPVARKELITMMLKVRPGSRIKLSINRCPAVAKIMASVVNKPIKWSI
jgi:hypothetical protein